MTAPSAEHDPQALNDALVDKLKADGVLHLPGLERAFRRVRRDWFLPALDLPTVYQDEALVTHRRTGSDEWISSSSQPAMMAIMLEQLGVEPGMRVLEIGAGTGYNAALLAELTEDTGNIWTLDVDEEFCAEARAHLGAAGKGGIHVICADGWQGWPGAAPYDRIIVTASAYDIAPAWFGQLRTGGVLVLPWGTPVTGQRSASFRKEGGGLVQQSSRPCGFMKMRGRFEWTDQAPPPPGDSWERPWSTALPPVSEHSLEDLASFLSLFLWPLVPTVFTSDERADSRDPNAARRLGLMDRSRRIVAGVELGPPWKTIGTGDRTIAEALEGAVLLWHQWGRPTPEQVHLAAFPRGSVPAPAPHQRLARREWCDYLVSVAGTLLP